MTEFAEGTIGKDGSLSIVKVRTLKQSSMRKCPHFIMVPGHYRKDESCRCDDENHTEMAEWGYVWDGNIWTSEQEDE
tara:strand:+ start:43 stop:273 length:231 start_codon:yes stop_codon:yes gene_type:complete